MIYVFAENEEAAAEFAMDSFLWDQDVKVITAPVHLDVVRFEVGDEVFILDGTSEECRYAARVAHDKSYPEKPHVFYKEEESVRA